MRSHPQVPVGCVLLGFAAALATTPLCAQVPWVAESPLPGTPVGAAGFSGTRGYLVGTGQQPFETIDGGLTWHERVLGNGGFLSVTFADAANGFLFGNHTTLGNGAYRTTDGGVVWTVLPNVPYGSYGHAQFISPTHGWIGTNTVLAETFDAGNSWTLVMLPTSSFQGRFAFRDAQIGLCGGGDGVYRTTNGGASWTQVATYLADTITFLDANTVLLSMPPQFGAPEFARSTDAGVTWTPIDVPNVALENPIKIDATTLVANVGGFARSDLYRSTDGALTWSLIRPGTWWPFEGGAFASPLIGIEMGYGGQIFRTTDAGLTWSQISSGMTTQWLEDIEMLDGTHGVAVGSDGTVLVTEDGGTQWRADRPGFEFSHGDTLLGVTTVQPNFVFAAGLYGTLIKSQDAGRTWQGVPGPGAGFGDYWTCKFVTPQEGWIAGGFQAIYHTTDGGSSWTQQYGGVQFGSAEAIYRIDFTDAMHGWAVGTFNGVLITTNGGATWTPHDFGVNFPFGREIDMVDSEVGWFASRESFVARTTNGGLSWTQQPIPVDPSTPEQFVFALRAVSATECWAATTKSRLYHTTDSGASWVYVDTLFHDPYDAWFGIDARASGDVWVAGGSGRIIRRLATAPEAGTVFCTGGGATTACPCGNSGSAGNGCSSSTFATGAHLGSSGSPRVAAGMDSLVLTITNSAGPGLFFQGDAQYAGGSGVAFGDGLLCASGAIVRLGVVFPSGNSASYPGGLTPSPIHVVGATAAGDVRHYQVWYRDASPGFCTSTTFNLTNGLSLTWLP